MTKQVMDWLVWVIEIVSENLCGGDKTKAYDMLKQNGILDWYEEHYELTHSLGQEYLLEEVREIVGKGGIPKC